MSKGTVFRRRNCHRRDSLFFLFRQGIEIEHREAHGVIRQDQRQQCGVRREGTSFFTAAANAGTSRMFSLMGEGATTPAASGAC